MSKQGSAEPANCATELNLAPFYRLTEEILVRTRDESADNEAGCPVFGQSKMVFIKKGFAAASQEQEGCFYQARMHSRKYLKPMPKPAKHAMLLAVRSYSGNSKHLFIAPVPRRRARSSLSRSRR